MDTRKKHINIEFDDETFTAIKVKCAQNGVKMSDVGRTLFRAWLDDDPHVKTLVSGEAPKKKPRAASGGK